MQLSRLVRPCGPARRARDDRRRRRCRRAWSWQPPSPDLTADAPEAVGLARARWWVPIFSQKLPPLAQGPEGGTRGPAGGSEPGRSALGNLTPLCTPPGPNLQVYRARATTAGAAWHHAEHQAARFTEERRPEAGDGRAFDLMPSVCTAAYFSGKRFCKINPDQSSSTPRS